MALNCYYFWTRKSLWQQCGSCDGQWEQSQSSVYMPNFNSFMEEFLCYKWDQEQLCSQNLKIDGNGVIQYTSDSYETFSKA